MTLKRRLTPLLLSILLTLTCAPTASAVWTDAAGTWASEVIQKASDYGLMEGYPDGRFGVGDYMTRAQFVTVLCRLFSWEPEPVQSTSIHRDCDGHWADPYIRAAARYGGIEGHGGLFYPDDYISRADMAKMLVQGLGCDALAQTLSGEPTPFPDVTDNRGYVTIAYDLGLINGADQNGTVMFLPTFSATREQAAAILVRCYERYTAQTDWLHGFYAFSSYSQIDYTDAMDAVSAGWARFEMADGSPLVNQTAEGGNDWVLPEGANLLTSRLAANGTPCYLNVYATASTFTQLELSGAQTEAVNRLAAAARPYSGLTIDFEGLRSGQKEAFTAFLTALRAALPETQALNVCVQPATWFDGYDYRALGEVCDKVILMAHDYQWSEIPSYYLGTANTYCPVTPFAQVYTALKQVTDPTTGVQDKTKLALAISFNTTGFHVDENGLLLDQTFYHPSKDTIAQRLQQPDAVRTWDKASHNPYLVYTAEDGEHYKLWYEDAQSVSDKITLAHMFGVTGVSIWRVGTIPDAPNHNVWSVFSP